MPNSRPAPGGSASYAGFEYQFLASVWMALKLIFDENKCQEIVIEPSSQEDVTAVINGTVGANDTVAIVGAPLDGYPIDVQIKRRSGAWTEASFRTVLQGEGGADGKRGPKPRSRPLEALKANPQLRFFLLTNAQVSSDLDDFVVTEIGSKSRAAMLPIQPAIVEAASVAPRIGILSEHPSAQLILDIDRLLRQYGHVPEAKVADCRRHLIDEVRLRVLGEAPGKLDRQDIQRVVVATGGRLDEAEGFVVPPVFAKLERQLVERHRLLLTGGPGIGKTDLAQELARRHQKSPDAFEIVLGKSGIELVREALNAPGNHLFLIEDPWGHDRLTDEADSWANELPKLFAKARPTKRFLVTSRAGVRHEALGEKPIPGFTDTEFELRPEHYSSADRREIMRRRLLDAKPWQRDWVNRYEKDWLKRLDRPLTIGYFASRVKPAKAESALEIEDVLRISDVDALAGIFEKAIEQRGPAVVAASLLIWAVHRVDEFVTLESVRTARSLTRAGGFVETLDPEQVLESFRSGGWFRSANDRLVAHPTALTGIESLLRTAGGTADDLLGAFLNGLIESGEASRAFAVIRHLELRPTAPSRRVREVVERKLLVDYMAADGYEAWRAFTYLAEHAISSRPDILFLKTLRSQRGHGAMASVEFWKPPTLTPQQRNEIRQSADAYNVARKFVIDVLPQDTWVRYSASDLVPMLQSFGWDFEPEFTDAALEALSDFHHNSRVDFLVEAAVLSRTKSISALTDAVLAAEDAATQMWTTNADERRNAEQAVFDGEYASHLEEEGSDLFSPIRRAGELIVRARRGTEGWGWLVTHPRASDLRWMWAGSIDGPIDQAEVIALATLAADNRAILWNALSNTEDLAHLPMMLADAPSVLVSDIGTWCRATAKLADDLSWRESVIPMLAKLPLAKRVVLAILSPRTEVEGQKFSALPSLISPLEDEIQEICGSAGEGKSWAGDITAAHREGLHELAMGGSPHFKRTAVIALAILKEDASAALSELSSSDDEESRRAALFATYLSGTDITPSVLTALRDTDYRVRRMALQLGAQTPTSEFIERLLETANDSSAPVRETCAKLIGELKVSRGLSVLVQLLQDRRDRRSSTITNQSWPEYHVARAAAEALGSFTLDTLTVDACLAFLQAPEKGDRSDDVTVHHHVMEALGSGDDDRLVPFFSAALDNPWYVSGQRDSGYPLRFTAAFCLAMQLERFPEQAKLVDLRRLVAAATHDDDRLAGPALLALGLCGALATPEIMAVSRAELTTPDRAILLEAMLPEGMQTVQAALRKVSGVLHPARVWLDLPGDKVPALSEWPEWRDRSPAFKLWIEGIQSSVGVNSWVRFVLGSRFGADVPAEFASDDKFDGVLPKPIGILSLRGMFGGE